METLQILSRSEMRNIKGGDFTDEYGCSYTGGRASCRSYYNCLTGVCTSGVFETGWEATTCVEEVQTLSLSC